MKNVYLFYTQQFSRLRKKISIITMVIVTLLLSNNLLSAQTYCTPIYSSGCSIGDDIRDVILLGDVPPGINNLNTPCGASSYTDYTSMSATLTPGNTYSGNVTTNYGGAYEDVRIWIDYNNNGVFENSEEIATLDDSSNASSGAFNFTVQNTISGGTYRMRVRLVYGQTRASSIDPCISYSWGETHDYSIVVMPQGPNNAGIASLTSPHYFCPGTEDIKIMVRNFGNNILDSVKVGWELDGVAQTPISITTPLDTAGGMGASEIEVT